MRHFSIVILLFCLIGCQEPNFLRCCIHSGNDQYSFDGSVRVPGTEYVIHLSDTTGNKRKYLYIKSGDDHLVQDKRDSCIAIIEIFKPQNPGIIVSFKDESIIIYDVSSKSRCLYSSISCLTYDSPNLLFKRIQSKNFAPDGCYNIGLSGYNNSIYVWPPYNSDKDEGYILMDSTIVHSFYEKNPTLYSARSFLFKVLFKK